jgi:hypothetical protein
LRRDGEHADARAGRCPGRGGHRGRAGPARGDDRGEVAEVHLHRVARGQPIQFGFCQADADRPVENADRGGRRTGVVHRRFEIPRHRQPAGMRQAMGDERGFERDHGHAGSKSG